MLVRHALANAAVPIVTVIGIGVALLIGGVVVTEFVTTGLVPRLPLAVLSAALFILAALCLTCGVIVSTINRRSAEIASLVPWKN